VRGSVPGSSFREGALQAAGIPALVLAAGYLGFGALAAGNGLSFTGTLLSTLFIWALPGQLILVEMHALGAPFFAVLVSVVLSAVRFLPMTIVLMPLLREAPARRRHYYVAAQLISMTGWAWTMVRFPSIPPERRLGYFFGFALTLLASASTATALGFLAGDLLPPLAKVAFVFMSPMYFLLMLTGSTSDSLSRAAVIGGAVVGPVAHFFTPQWSVLLAGLVGGTLAYVAHRAWRAKTRAG
jgi:predicted branched-subunit amino acid permease